MLENIDKQEDPFNHQNGFLNIDTTLFCYCALTSWHAHCCISHTPTAAPCSDGLTMVLCPLSVCLQERGFPSSSRLSRSTPTPSPPPTVTAAQRCPTPPQTPQVRQICIVLSPLGLIKNFWMGICRFSYQEV